MDLPVATAEVTQSRPGRQLDRRRDQVILQATLTGLADLGYDRLTMDEVAARAHVSKGTIYRRWSSKANLVVDAVLHWREQIAPIVPPNTGSLLGDLEAMAAQVPDFDDAAKRQIAVVLGLVGAASRDRALQKALAGGFERPRQTILDVLRGAAARGEISPEADIELVPDIVMGLNLLRMMVLGEPIDRRFVARVLRNIVYPLVAADPGGA